MRTVLGLKVHLGVLTSASETITFRWRGTYPVLVVKYNGVSSSQIDPEAASTGAKEEQLRGIGVVTTFLEDIHLLAPLERGCRTINTA